MRNIFVIFFSGIDLWLFYEIELSLTVRIYFKLFFPTLLMKIFHFYGRQHFGKTSKMTLDAFLLSSLRKIGEHTTSQKVILWKLTL